MTRLQLRTTHRADPPSLFKTREDQTLEVKRLLCLGFLRDLQKLICKSNLPGEISA